jgi:hypothetical protein
MIEPDGANDMNIRHERTERSELNGNRPQFCKNILAPIDLSKETKVDLDTAIALAEHYNADLWLLGFSSEPAICTDARGLCHYVWGSWDRRAQVWLRDLVLKAREGHYRTFPLFIGGHYDAEEIIRTANLTLVAVGRIPNIEHLNLGKVGLPKEGFLEVNAQMQTKVPSIFAVGDLNGMMLLDSAAYAQARVAVQTILGEKAMFEPHWIPRCLHTEPPIAAAGWTEAEAVAAGHQVDVLSENLPLITDDDATMIQPDRNLLKLVVQNSTGRILGCLAIGSRAAEVVNLASTAIRNGLTAQRLADLSLIHPSASEAMVRLLQDHFDRLDRC